MIASTETNHPMAISQNGQKTQTSIEQACACLKNARLRITQPRISILTSLINRSVPARIEQIHGDLPPDTCDLVTVYRCLATFQKIGLVRLSYFHNGASAYQITLNAGQPAPYHIISRDDEVQELDPESASELHAVIAKIEDRLRASGKSNISHIVEFFVENPSAPERAIQGREFTRMPAEMPDALQMRGVSAASISG